MTADQYDKPESGPSASPHRHEIPLGSHHTIQRGKGFFRDQFKNISNLTKQSSSEVTRENARHLLYDYLTKNVRDAETIESMRPLIDEFRSLAPRLFVLKCIDGRVHGSKGKGYPPTAVKFHRTEGSELDTSRENRIFWNRKMDPLIIDAAHNTPGKPALFIALAHTGGEEGGGCAAQTQKYPDKPKAEVVGHSLETVESHAKAVREKYKEKVFALHGITNTDDMSEKLFFANGTELSTADIISKLDITNPSDVFSGVFLQESINDPSITDFIGDTTVGALIAGDTPSMYNDLTTGVAMETYLLKRISQGDAATLLNPEILKEIERIFKAAEDIPDSLRSALLHQTVWNIAYTLYQRQRLKRMSDPDEREDHLQHAETLICFGEGFELLPRNSAVLAKTGRGDDRKTLETAKGVLTKNRAKMVKRGKPQLHPPVIHINVEVDGAMTDWPSFNRQVLSRIKEMSESVHEVFSNDVVIMTTYSYAAEKKFYPTSVFPEDMPTPISTSPLPINLSAGLTDTSDFAKELQRREHEYAALIRANDQDDADSLTSPPPAEHPASED